MTKGLSIALMIAGVVLLVFGFRASDSVSSDFSRFFTDSPTDKAIWLLILGGAALVIGLFGIGRGRMRAA
jgi:hypothetical protein